MHKEMLNYEIPVHGHEGEPCSSMGALNPYGMPGGLSVQNIIINDMCRDGKESPAVTSATVPFSLLFLTYVSSATLRQATNRIAKPFNSQQITS